MKISLSSCRQVPQQLHPAVLQLPVPGLPGRDTQGISRQTGIRCKYPLYQANPYYTALTARWLRADRLFWRLELGEAATIWGHGVANLTWGAGAGPGIRWGHYPASVIPLLPIILRLLSLYIRLLKIISRLLTINSRLLAIIIRLLSIIICLLIL